MIGTPLDGKTVVVTRSPEDARAFASRLETLGARVLAVPTIRFAPAEDLRDWREALERRRDVTHLVFTSRHAVGAFLKLTEDAGISRSSWSGCRVAAIGGSTAASLEAAGYTPLFVPERSTGAGFAAELVEKEGVGPGSVVLLPQSAIARPDVADYLESAGALVLAVSVYETLAEEPETLAPLRDALDRGGGVDAITFASPSAVRAFIELAGTPGRRLLESSGCRIVTIGPTTSRAIRDAGLRPAVESSRPDLDSLVEAVVSAVVRT